jgi:hypothetical protein
MTAAYTTYTNFPGQGTTWSNSNLLQAMTTSQYIIGWFDGEQRMRIFDNSVSLPVLATSVNTNPSVLPPSGSVFAGYGQTGNTRYGSGATPAITGYVQVASGLALWQNQYVDSAGNTQVGAYWFALTFASGSADVGSTAQFMADAYLGLVTSTLSQ